MALNRYYSSTKYESRAKIVALGIKCVFISHQQRDKDEAKKIADYLKNSGIDVYFDEYDGDLRIHRQSNNPKALTNSIKEGINNSSHMLVLISSNTMYSTWVLFEIGYGYDKTELFVLCLKGISKGALPDYAKTATTIRDIYDLNNFIGRVSGLTKESLLETKMLSDHSSYNNPLSNVMGSLIAENY